MSAKTAVLKSGRLIFKVKAVMNLSVVVNELKSDQLVKSTFRLVKVVLRGY